MSRNRKMPRYNIEDVINRLATWTHDDERLAGLPDPLGATRGIPDRLVRLWEESFLQAIASDQEYWQERTSHRCGEGPSSPIESMLDPDQINMDILLSIMDDRRSEESIPQPIKRSWIRRLIKHCFSVER